jgi:hypothetical protein
VKQMQAQADNLQSQKQQLTELLNCLAKSTSNYKDYINKVLQPALKDVWQKPNSLAIAYDYLSGKGDKYNLKAVYKNIIVLVEDDLDAYERHKTSFAIKEVEEKERYNQLISSCENFLKGVENLKQQLHNNDYFIEKDACPGQIHDPCDNVNESQSSWCKIS